MTNHEAYNHWDDINSDIWGLRRALEYGLPPAANIAVRNALAKQLYNLRKARAHLHERSSQ